MRTVYTLLLIACIFTATFAARLKPFQMATKVLEPAYGAAPPGFLVPDALIDVGESSTHKKAQKVPSKQKKVTMASRILKPAYGAAPPGFLSPSAEGMN